MILQCPSCNARFLVADALIPPLGRTVRCGACSFQWFVEPPKVEAVPVGGAAPEQVDFATLAEAASSSEGPTPELVSPNRLPVVQSRFFAPKPFRIAAFALAACWLFAAAIAYFPRAERWPVVGGLYHMAGVRDTSGLVFGEISMERAMDGDKTQFVLSGAIVNHAAQSRHVPEVRVQLKNKKGAVIWARTYPVNHTMTAGESYPFRITDVETSFADDVSAIVLDLGNPLELAIR